MPEQPVFPPPIMELPQADIPLPGVRAYLSQSEKHQIIFMEFSEDIPLPEHAHEAQWGIVLAGRIDLVIGGTGRTYRQGDRYFIPAGTPHSGRIFAGYADITFFGQPKRYQIKAK